MRILSAEKRSLPMRMAVKKAKLYPRSVMRTIVRAVITAVLCAAVVCAVRRTRIK
jgi:hypothetical protein